MKAKSNVLSDRTVFSDEVNQVEWTYLSNTVSFDTNNSTDFRCFDCKRKHVSDNEYRNECK